ncbi:MAG: leucine--tRNA ligase [Clostridia bacterium]|nr:leucine--tRNA ligase [Clostridia bacterium]
MEYNFSSIEKKWQKKWDDNQTFKTSDDYSKPKFYALVEFPYPSGQGLHVGHPRSYTALDIVSRKKRLQGYNVLYPMGWDAFGLPTENFAIKNKIHPKIVTENNVARFKEQLKSLGFSFDWSKEINTTDPEYFKWTQWIFLKLFEKDLAYKKEMAVNWCTSCKCVLANEEVVNGVCERCGSEVVRKVKSQWMLKITEYAERLINDLDDVDYIERVKIQQKNWIGKSTGAEVDFTTTAEDKLTVFTTRPDTLFGATYMVMSPEHPYLEKWADKIENNDEIKAYQVEANKKSDFERTELAKDKTGVCIKGVKAINPVNGKEIPIYISDYVLMSYGTGAIMAVPAHDTRDFDFAKAFDLPIIEVVAGGDVQNEAFTDVATGKLVNSGFLDGLEVAEAKKAIIEWLTKEGLGKEKVNYKLRDWVFSRQRYWGEPIPIVHCEHCGYVPVDEKELPLKLPDIDSYEPTENGESPLANIDEWVNTTCPKCGAPAKRETDTMPQWAGSSWYFLRYIDPTNKDAIASKEAINYWTPVDWYNGGMEHTTLHLLYSRFWHKFLYDIGVVPTKEPYAKRTSHGMILGENGEKMSKSRGNVVNPDDIVNEYGADTMRLYEMFIGDFEKSAPWSQQGIKGCSRFLERIWALNDALVEGESYSEKLEKAFHKTIKKVTEDIEQLKFNTAIAAIMALLNDIYKAGKINKAEFKTLIVLLNPFAPHITEEMWEMAGFEGMLNQTEWPSYDEAKTVDNEVEIAIQINGKIKDKLVVAADISQADCEAVVKELDSVKPLLDGKQIVKVIYVPKKLINIVVK